MYFAVLYLYILFALYISGQQTYLLLVTIKAKRQETCSVKNSMIIKKV